MSEYYVYMYLREDGTPYYIGKGKGNRAYSKHRSGMRVKVPAPNRIKLVYNNLTEDIAFTKEKELILRYGKLCDNTGILMNITDGGEGSSGRKHTEDSKKKISKSLKDNINASGSEPYNKGKTGLYKHTEETKKILSELNRGKIPWNKGKSGLQKHSDETKDKLSVMFKGRLGRDMKGSNNTMYGRKHSDETKKKMSDAKRKNRLVATEL